MLRASKLEAGLYDEIEADTTATIQALKAVLLAIWATGIGWSIRIIIEEGFGWAIWYLLFGVCSATILWLLWSFITYLVGTRLFRRPEKAATYRDPLRTLGFSNSPGIIGIASFIPYLGCLTLPITLIWVSIAAVIAVRQALDFSTWRAISTYVIGWVIYVAVLVAPVLVLYGIVRVA